MKKQKIISDDEDDNDGCRGDDDDGCIVLGLDCELDGKDSALIETIGLALSKNVSERVSVLDVLSCSRVLLHAVLYQTDFLFLQSLIGKKVDLNRIPARREPLSK